MLTTIDPWKLLSATLSLGKKALSSSSPDSQTIETIARKSELGMD